MMNRTLTSAVLALGLAHATLAAPPLPATPAPVLRLVAVRPWVAAEPLGFTWDRTQPPSRRGYLLVVEADPGLVAFRQEAEPNLQSGEHLAARAGRPTKAGRALYLLPADVDLGGAPLFFGSPKLPESLTEADVQREVGRAVALGLKAPLPAHVAEALAAGGAEVTIETLHDLAAAKADLRARFLAAAAAQP